MKVIILVLMLITSINIRVIQGQAIDANTIITRDGHMWEIDIKETGNCIVAFDTRGTDEVTDDIPVAIIYQ